MSNKEDYYFEIINSENSLRIEKLKLTHPKAKNSWDKNWLTAKTKFQLGSFIGEYEFNAQIEDFNNFLNQVENQYNNLIGESNFQSREDQVEIKLELDKSGIIEVNFELTDKVGVGNNLNGNFQIDQSYLPKLIEQLESIRDKFHRE